MRRPTIPPKPAAQHPPAPRTGRAADEEGQPQARPDEQPASRSELVEDIGGELPLSPTLLDVMRELAKDGTTSRPASRRSARPPLLPRSLATA